MIRKISKLWMISKIRKISKISKLRIIRKVSIISKISKIRHHTNDKPRDRDTVVESGDFDSECLLKGGGTGASLREVEI